MSDIIVPAIPAAWRARKTELAEHALRMFVNRRDVWGQYIEPSRRKGPKAPKVWTAPKKDERGKRELLPARLAMHFAGATQNDLIGFHTTSRINTSRFGAIEIDRHGDEPTIEVTTGAARYWYDKGSSLGFVPLLLDSNGAGGFHLIFPFSEPVSTPRVFHFLRWLASDFKNHGLQKMPETFPKQQAIVEGKFGNLLRLWGRHHTRDHWTRVWDGMEWREGAQAIDLILATKGNDPAIIPADAAPPKAKPRIGAAPLPTDAGDKVRRCDAYIAKMKDAISGQHGHDATFAVCCELWRFGLDNTDACNVIERWNAGHTGGEPWSKDELVHKLADAKAKVEGAGEFGIRLTEKRPDRDDKIESALQRRQTAGELPEIPVEATLAPTAKGEFSLSAPLADKRSEPAADGPDDGFQILDRGDPLPTARKFIGEHYRHNGNPTLLHAGDAFYAWDEIAYRDCEPGALRAKLYPWLEWHKRIVKDRRGLEQIVAYQPRKSDIELTVDALKGLTYTADRAPAWLGGRDGPNPAHLLVAPNGIFHLTADGCRKHCGPTPLLFTVNALDYPVDLDAADPVDWIGFVNQTWPDDPDSVDLLQEYFGLILTAETRHQKMLGLIGPPRSGKGTICRVISHTAGMENVCGPTLSGLGTNFGLWPLLNKRLAIISDARLSGRTDQATITERLLSITGEDALTVDRKNLSQITTKLTTRIILCSNELPRLSDSSGALANRFLLLMLRESHLGREDTGLTDRLLAERPGILRWAIEGWRRLCARGRFIQPATSQQAIEELQDLASPVGAFIRDWCSVAPGLCIPIRDLFEAWGLWCREQGRDHQGDTAGFGRNLRAAVAGIGTTQPRMNGSRHRVFEGIDLTEVSKLTLSNERAAQQYRDTASRHYGRSVGA